MKRLAALVGVVVAVGVLAVLAVQVQRDVSYRELLASGEHSLQAGNAYAAIEAFSGALALRPNSMVALYRRGEAYRVLRQDVEAIENVLQAHRLAPEAPPIKHTHPGEEIIYILEGSLEYEVEGQPTITCKAGDALTVPAGVGHSVRNVGSSNGGGARHVRRGEGKVAARAG